MTMGSIHVKEGLARMSSKPIWNPKIVEKYNHAHGEGGRFTSGGGTDHIALTGDFPDDRTVVVPGSESTPGRATSNEAVRSRMTFKKTGTTVAPLSGDTGTLYDQHHYTGTYVAPNGHKHQLEATVSNSQPKPSAPEAPFATVEVSIPNPDGAIRSGTMEASGHGSLTWGPNAEGTQWEPTTTPVDKLTIGWINTPDEVRHQGLGTAMVEFGRDAVKDALGIPVEHSTALSEDGKAFVAVTKYNHTHDKGGRFGSGASVPETGPHSNNMTPTEFEVSSGLEGRSMEIQSKLGSDTFINGLDDHEASAALSKYSRDNNGINGSLRRGEKPSVTDALDRAIAANTIPEKIEVYRGRTDRIHAKVGDILTDKGYTSVTTSFGAAAFFASPDGLPENNGSLFSIHVPAGTHAAGLRQGGEKEILLGRNTSMRITGAGRNEDGVELYNAEVVSPVQKYNHTHGEGGRFASGSLDDQHALASARVDTATSEIERVTGVKLSPVTVEVAPNKGSVGTYFPERKTIAVKPGGHGEGVGRSSYVHSDDATVVHEMSHHLDYQLGTGTGADSKPLSELAVKGKAPGEQADAMRNFYKVATTTDSGIGKVLSDSKRGRGLTSKTTAKYVSSPSEVFARAMTQNVDLANGGDFGRQSSFGTHEERWDDGEFSAKVAPALNAIFAQPVSKYNHSHGEGGRFASGPSHSNGSAPLTTGGGIGRHGSAVSTAPFVRDPLTSTEGADHKIGQHPTGEKNADVRSRMSSPKIVNVEDNHDARTQATFEDATYTGSYLGPNGKAYPLKAIVSHSEYVQATAQAPRASVVVTVPGGPLVKQNGQHVSGILMAGANGKVDWGGYGENSRSEPIVSAPKKMEIQWIETAVPERRQGLGTAMLEFGRDSVKDALSKDVTIDHSSNLTEFGQQFVQVTKYNHAHGVGGRFTTTTGGSFTAGGVTSKPLEGRAADAWNRATAEGRFFSDPANREEFRNTLQQRVDSQSVAMRMSDDSLLAFGKEGHYKTQAEGGKPGQGVLFNPVYRGEQESKMFENSKNPVYGYMAAPGTPSKNTNLNRYGKNRLFLSPDVKDRTTITVADSLGGWVRPSAVKHVSAESIPLEETRVGFSTKNPKQRMNTFLNEFQRDSYIEAQIHGGVKPTDVVRIELDGGGLDKIKELAPLFPNAEFGRVGEPGPAAFGPYGTPYTELIQKYNHNHGKGGEFTSGTASVTSEPVEDPGKGLGWHGKPESNGGVVEYLGGRMNNLDEFTNQSNAGVPDSLLDGLNRGTQTAARVLPLMDAAGVLTKPLANRVPPTVMVVDAPDRSELQGMFQPKNSQLMLNGAGSANAMDFTFVHEYAHSMDSNSFPGARNPFINEKTGMPNPPGLSLVDAKSISQKAVRGQGMFAPWWEAVKDTEIMKKLKYNDTDFAKYAKQPQEVFARSIAQYVARKTNNHLLTASLNRLQAQKGTTQWQDKDFEPVYDALDKIFHPEGSTK